MIAHSTQSPSGGAYLLAHVRAVIGIATIILIPSAARSQPSGFERTAPSAAAASIGTDRLLTDQVNQLRNEVHAGGTVPDHIARLRLDLRQLVKTEIGASGGGSVELALRRAAVNFHLEIINAYEATFGDATGVATTRWNEFSSDELSVLETRLRRIHAGLTEVAAPFPEANTPLELRGRIAEVRQEIEGLIAEQALRNDRAPIMLKSFPSGLTVADAQRHQLVEAVLGVDQEVRAERLLRAELEYRLAWNPTDPHLTVVRENIKNGKFASVVTRFQEPPSGDGWPPPRAPPPPGGPPQGSAPPDGPLGPPSGASVDELANAAEAELNATK